MLCLSPGSGRCSWPASPLLADRHNTLGGCSFMGSIRELLHDPQDGLSTLLCFNCVWWDFESEAGAMVQLIEEASSTPTAADQGGGNQHL